MEEYGIVTTDFANIADELYLDLQGQQATDESLALPSKTSETQVFDPTTM